MRTYQFVLCGVFADAYGTKTPIEFPEFGNETVRGFYTTRIVDADDYDQAISLAADSVQKELSASFIKPLGFTLEVDSCDEVVGPAGPDPPRGFTFFCEE